MGKIKVLFVSYDNGIRSQMAAAWVNHLFGDRFDAHSAGISPARTVNPLAVKVMEERGIDISGKKTRSVFDIYKSGTSFSYIITVCDLVGAEKCPVFLGLVKQFHWDFPNISVMDGPEDKIVVKLRSISDSIREKIVSWCEEVYPVWNP
jgi:arsenate reductase